MSEGLAPSMQGKVANSQVSNPVSAALEALKSGKDVEQTVYGSSSPSKSLEESASPEGTGKTFSEAFMSGELDEQGSEVVSEESSQESLQPESSTEEQAKEASKDVEEIIISDETGRKKITVDWNDRTKLKRYVEMAAGARKAIAKADTLTKRIAELETQANESREFKDSWTAVENAYSKEGLRGLINLVTGDSQGYEKLVQKELQRAEFRKTATPGELERLDLEEKLQAEARERAKLQQQIESIGREAKADKESALQKSLEAHVTPAFNKHRFAGKLGDQKAEERLDRSIWRDAVDSITALPDHVELTPALIDQHFREAANSYRKLITKTAEEKTKQVIQTKKAAAQESAATMAMKGMKTNSASEDFRSNIRKGDLTSALTSVLTGKLRL